MFNFNSVVRNTGRTYKSIYANGNPLSDSDEKALREKYIGIERKVYWFGQHSMGVDPNQDLSIVYHGISWGCLSGNNTHLEFDEQYPVIHFISYDTDVIDYNIKTKVTYEGNTYSPSTSKQMGDFNALFRTYSTGAKVDKYTGIIRNFTIVKEGHTPIFNLAHDSMDVGLVDTLAQVPLFDDLFVNVDKAKCFKYQKQQITDMFVGFISNYGNLFSNSDDVYEHILHDKMTKKDSLMLLRELDKALHTTKESLINVEGSFDVTDKRLAKAILDLDINKETVGKASDGMPLTRERNLGKSLIILSKVVSNMISSNSKDVVNE